MMRPDIQKLIKNNRELLSRLDMNPTFVVKSKTPPKLLEGWEEREEFRRMRVEREFYASQYTCIGEPKDRKNWDKHTTIRVELFDVPQDTIPEWITSEMVVILHPHSYNEHCVPKYRCIEMKHE